MELDTYVMPPSAPSAAAICSTSHILIAFSTHTRAGVCLPARPHLDSPLEPLLFGPGGLGHHQLLLPEPLLLLPLLLQDPLPLQLRLPLRLLPRLPSLLGQGSLGGGFAVVSRLTTGCTAVCWEWGVRSGGENGVGTYQYGQGRRDEGHDRYRQVGAGQVKSIRSG